MGFLESFLLIAMAIILVWGFWSGQIFGEYPPRNINN